MTTVGHTGGSTPIPGPHGTWVGSIGAARDRFPTADPRASRTMTEADDREQVAARQVREGMDRIWAIFEENRRRARERATTEDLSGLDIRGRKLDGDSHPHALLDHAHLDEANCAGVDFTGSRGAFVMARGTDLREAVLDDCAFQGSLLIGADVRYSSANRASFAGCDMESANFHGADLLDTDFTAADLAGADFAGTRAAGSTFARAGCSRVTFAHADLTGADFTGADLTGADFTGANITGAKFTGALLRDSTWDEAPPVP